LNTKQRERLSRLDRPCPGLNKVKCGRMCKKGQGYCVECIREYARKSLSRLDRPCPGRGGDRCGRMCKKGESACAECIQGRLNRMDRPCPGPSTGIPCGRMCTKGWTHCVECERERQLVINYGINSAEFERTKEAQGNLCDICGDPPPDVHPFCLSVDHIPGTRKVRALLCMQCNTGAGQFKHSPELLEKAAAYIRKHRPVEGA